MGIGQITKIAGKILHSNAAKAVGRGLVRTGKVISYPTRKGWQLPTYLADKIKNPVVGFSVGAGSIAIPVLTPFIPMIVNDKKTPEEVDYKSDKEGAQAYLRASRWSDTAIGTILGCLLGGPIGAVVGGTAAFIANKDIIYGHTNGDFFTENCRADYNELYGKQAKKDSEPSQTEEPKAPAEKTDETKVAQEEEPTTSNEGTESTAVVEQPSQPQRGTAEEGNKSQQTPVAAQNNSEDSSATVNTSERQKNKQKSEETQTNHKTTTVQAEENEEPANIDKNNLFNGEIKEITNASVVVVKGDCLWNIAKRELRAANPDKVITNAQILKQVKEFGRLNPEIVDLNLIYPDQTIKLRA